MTPLLAVVVLLMAVNAFAQSAAMPSLGRSPFDLSLLAVYSWVVVIAMFGGAANFIRKVKSGQARAFNFVEFVGELVISAFAGIMTYWFCEWANVNPWLTAAFVGVSGHMGSRAIFMGEQTVERAWKRLTGNGNIEQGR